MKQILIILVALSCLLLFSCSEDSPESPPQDSTGKLFIKSTPSGARIYLQGNDTGKNTPDTLDNLPAGTINGYLYLEYFDTAYFSIPISANLITTKEIILNEDLPFVELTWDFSIRSGGDSVQFSFQLNQDLLMDSIVVSRPITIFGDYTKDRYVINNQLFVWRDQNGYLVTYYLPLSGSAQQFYPKIDNYLYRIDVYGQQAHGYQSSFYSFYTQQF
jgi:hypothetical protein